MRYLVIGGRITSPNDGDRHYISPKRLMELYDVAPRQCLTFPDDDTVYGVRFKDYVVLRPRPNGDYKEWKQRQEQIFIEDKVQDFMERADKLEMRIEKLERPIWMKIYVRVLDRLNR